MILSINNFSNTIYSATPARSSAPVQSVDALGKKENDNLDPSLQVSAVKSSDSKLSLSEEGKALSKEDNLSEEDLKTIEELKKRDQEVRTHEQAHQSAAGSLSNGGASFDYQTGPDGNRYAVGGEVSIDTAKVANDPQATIAKARQIRSAALAPASPSGQDRQVAAQAVKMEAEANKQLIAQRQEESTVESKAMNSSKTDFYQQIQSSASQSGTSGQNNGSSRLDYYA